MLRFQEDPRDAQQPHPQGEITATPCRPVFHTCNSASTSPFVPFDCWQAPQEWHTQVALPFVRVSAAPTARAPRPMHKHRTQANCMFAHGRSKAPPSSGTSERDAELLPRPSPPTVAHARRRVGRLRFDVRLLQRVPVSLAVHSNLTHPRMTLRLAVADANALLVRSTKARFLAAQHSPSAAITTCCNRLLTVVCACNDLRRLSHADEPAPPSPRPRRSVRRQLPRSRVTCPHVRTLATHRRRARCTGAASA